MLLFSLLTLITSLPNYIIFIADDLGWNDVGYHGSNIPTPTIDRLANNGLKLENHYVHLTCTPTRASLLTGRYATNTGLTSALLFDNPFGLTGNTLAKEFQKKNYTTSLIGKWHLGHARREFTPMYNGFDYFYGIYGAGADNYNKKLFGKFDLHENFNHVHNETYASDLYTDKALEQINNEPFFMIVSHQASHTPLQAPDRYLKHCYMKNKWRKIFCGMTVSLDESLNRIEMKLKEEDLWNDTVILFMTDNGGQPWFGASNYPYRGTKNSVYEGGVKGVAFLTGGYIENRVKTHTYDGLIHVSDWYEAFLGQDSNGKYNMMHILLNNLTSPRTKMLIHRDIYSNSIVYRENEWKLIIGNAGDNTLYQQYDKLKCPVNKDWIDWLTCFFINFVYEDFFFYEVIRETRNTLKGNSIGGNMIVDFGNYDTQLFNLKDDPYESNNLANISKAKIKEMMINLNNTIDFEQEQYKWETSDANVKFDRVGDNHYHYPWITGNYEIKETSFLHDYLYVKIGFPILYIMLIGTVLLRTYCIFIA